jgi:hypothetical protein
MTKTPIVLWIPSMARTLAGATWWWTKHGPKQNVEAAVGAGVPAGVAAVMAAAGAATGAGVAGAVAAVVVIEVIAAETAVTEAIAGKWILLKILGDLCALSYRSSFEVTRLSVSQGITRLSRTWFSSV